MRSSESTKPTLCLTARLSLPMQPQRAGVRARRGDTCRREPPPPPAASRPPSSWSEFVLFESAELTLRRELTDPRPGEEEAAEVLATSTLVASRARTAWSSKTCHECYGETDRMMHA